MGTILSRIACNGFASVDDQVMYASLGSMSAQSHVNKRMTAALSETNTNWAVRNLIDCPCNCRGLTGVLRARGGL